MDGFFIRRCLVFRGGGTVLCADGAAPVLTAFSVASDKAASTFGAFGVLSQSFIIEYIDAIIKFRQYSMTVVE